MTSFHKIECRNCCVNKLHCLYPMSVLLHFIYDVQPVFCLRERAGKLAYFAHSPVCARCYPYTMGTGNNRHSTPLHHASLSWVVPQRTVHLDCDTAGPSPHCHHSALECMHGVTGGTDKSKAFIFFQALLGHCLICFQSNTLWWQSYNITYREKDFELSVSHQWVPCIIWSVFKLLLLSFTHRLCKFLVAEEGSQSLPFKVGHQGTNVTWLMGRTGVHHSRLVADELQIARFLQLWGAWRNSIRSLRCMPGEEVDQWCSPLHHPGTPLDPCRSKAVFDDHLLRPSWWVPWYSLGHQNILA